MGGNGPRKRPITEPADSAAAERARAPEPVYLTEAERKAHLTFPDYKQGQTGDGKCYINNCTGRHNWRGCSNPANQTVSEVE